MHYNQQSEIETFQNFACLKISKLLLLAAPAEPAGGAELGSGQPAAQLSADAESIEIVFHSIVAQILRHNNVSEYKVSASSIEKFL